MARNFYSQAVGGYSSGSNEMINNVWAFYEAVSSVDSTITIAAISGILGNIAAESGYNPTRWQSDIPYSGGGGGYGLIQWTPWTNLWDYVTNYTDGIEQSKFIDEEIRSNNQGRMGWVWGSNSYPISQDAFCALTSPSDAAFYYLYNRERPGDPSATLQYRKDQADYCYTILTGSPPPGPGPGPGPQPPVTFSSHFTRKRQNYKRRKLW